MGMLFSALWARLFAYKEFKICIVGLDNAGKTTTLFQLHLGEVVETQPTVGSNVESVVHKNVHFQVWDLGGQEALRSNWATYFTNTHAVILVVDSTDEKRLDVSRQELFKLLEHEQLKSSVLLVLANKQDLKSRCLSAAQIATRLSLTSIKSHPWHIQPCSALRGEGLFEGMDWITTRVTKTG